MPIHIRSGLCLFILVLLFGPVHLICAQPGGGGPSPVIVSRVVKTHQLDSKSFVGSLVPLKRSTVGSAVDGRVTKMFVEEGDLVSGDGDGDPLVQLRTVSLNIEIEAAQVELRLRQESEQELQQSLPAEIASAEAVVEEVKARLEFSKENYERLLNLNKSGGGVPQQEVNQAYSTFQSQKQLALGAQTLLEKLKVTRESRLQQARSKVEAQEAEIKRLQELKDEYTIRAPFTGYVTSKNTELGQWVTRGETVLEIIQLDPIELVVPVPQTYIQSLQEALEKHRTSDSKLMAQVTVDSLPHLLEGEVVTSIPQADLRSRSFPVKIRLKNPQTPSGHLLKAGMLARATMFIGDEADILLVKKDALVLGGLDKSVYVVAQDPKTQTMIAKLVPVEVGASIKDWIQIIGDVKEGDQVVVVGNERLRPGQSIAVAQELPDTLPSDSGASISSMGQ